MTGDKRILTCAVTGGAPFTHGHPSFPVTPEQIATSAIEAARAGATVAHVHVRDPVTGAPSRARPLFREVVDRIRSSGTDVVINLTCGPGGTFVPDPGDEARAAPGTDMAPAPERVAHVLELLPEICTLDLTTVMFRGNAVFLNTPRTLARMAELVRDAGVRPELEIFHPGDMALARQLLEGGQVAPPPLFQFVTGTGYGMPSVPEAIPFFRTLLPDGAVWAGFGISRMQFPILEQVLELGGHVRVGLEDNLYLERGIYASNAQLVEKAVAIAARLGHAIATPAEARAMLGLRTASVAGPRAA